MLGLKMATDPRWVNIVEKNIQEILIDHAYCEQKAASNAISMIVQYPQYPDLVEAMTAICQEEMEHFNMVHQKLQDAVASDLKYSQKKLMTKTYVDSIVRSWKVRPDITPPF